MDVFDLSAKITLDSSDFTNGLSTASSNASSFSTKFSKALKVGAAATAAVTTATTALVGTVTKLATKTASYGDNVDKMSQKIGFSTEAYQKWDYVMQRAGTDVSVLRSGIKTLSQKAQKGSEAFDQLGISQEKAASMGKEELFAEVVNALSQMEEGTKRSALATELLGKTGPEIAPLLNQGTEAIKDQMEMAEQYGLIMSEDAVKASADFEDSLTTLKGTISGAKNSMIGEFLPSITTVMDGLALLFTGDEGGIAKMEQGIDDFVTNLSDLVPKMLEVGTSILSTLANAIIDNLPSLIESATSIMLQIVTTLIESLPKIITTALKIITTLGNGIANSLPKLIPALVNTMIAIVNGLIDNLPMIISTALKIIVALGKGLIDALPTLIANIPKIIKSMVSALKKGISEIRSIGRNLIEGLWNGINDKVEWIKSKIKGFGESVLNSIKDIFGIASPSKETKKIGRFLAEGLGIGWEDEIGSVMDTINSDLDFKVNPVDTNKSLVSGIVNGLMPIATNNINNTDSQYNITLQIDKKTLANIMFDPLNDVATRRGLSFV